MAKSVQERDEQRMRRVNEAFTRRDAIAYFRACNNAGYAPETEPEQELLAQGEMEVRRTSRDYTSLETQVNHVKERQSSDTPDTHRNDDEHYQKCVKFLQAVAKIGRSEEHSFLFAQPSAKLHALIALGVGKLKGGRRLTDLEHTDFDEDRSVAYAIGHVYATEIPAAERFVKAYEESHGGKK